MSAVDAELAGVSRIQFRAALAASRHRALCLLVPFYVGFMGLFWAIGLITDETNRSGVPLDLPLRWLVIAGLVLFVFGGVWALSRVSRHPVLKCQKCSHPLASGMSPYIALVTGRCPV